jgi:hypothetical protein
VWIRRLPGLRGVRPGRGGRLDSIRFDAVSLADVDCNALHKPRRASSEAVQFDPEFLKGAIRVKCIIKACEI